MANLDLDPLISSAVARGARFFIARGAFASNPRCEEDGRVEFLLKVADDLGRGDIRWFINCWWILLAIDAS